MLKVTQGDTITFQLTALLGNGLPYDLTGATFTTLIKGPNGIVVSFPNSQHTANPDQTANKGKYTLALTADNTDSLGLGINKEIITKVTQGSNIVQFHGNGILTVLAKVPVQ